MKTVIKSILALSVITCLFACNKTNPTIDQQAAGAVNVTNAVIGSPTLTLTTSKSVVSSNNTVGINGYAWFPLVAGNIPVNLGVPAVAATPTTAAIPAVAYYTNTLTINNNSNYSLFLSGASPASVDNVLIQENYTKTYSDSTCGVRFINLAPGSNPISVNLKGNPNGSEVPSIAYKAYSNFVMHPAKSVNSSYTFEFRDVTTGDLINTYTLTTPYFHNVTLCLRGIVGGSNGIILDADY